MYPTLNANTHYQVTIFKLLGWFKLQTTEYLKNWAFLSHDIKNSEIMAKRLHFQKLSFSSGSNV